VAPASARRSLHVTAEDATIAEIKVFFLLCVLCVLCGLVLAAAVAPTVTFADATARAGLTFVHTSGAFGKKYLPETLGAGCLFLDIDGDGWQDIFLVNSTRWPGQPGAKGLPALYRNNHDGTFVDVTRGSGLDVELYGIGGTAADFDNDGKVDLYVTALGGNRLFRNLGAGKFADVTGRAGVADAGFSTSALWFDYDNDGRLDLFVAHYVDWSIEKDLFCTLDGRSKSYCTPESYKGQSPTLYRNRGDGTFEDVTRRAGLYDPTSKGLGVAMLDYDGDGRMDLFVANDTQPNRLYRNKGDGTFADAAVAAGVAFNEAGIARAGMGVDAADYDESGRPSLVIGNFSNEMMALYHNEGTGLFIDEAPTSAIGKASLLTLTFGCFFFDYDLDGRPDIFAANGHVADDIERVQSRVAYAQRPHLFHNLGRSTFEEVTPRSGAALQAKLVGRGAAYADIDNDGDLDLLVTTNNGPARLFRNDGGNRNNAIRIKTIGTRSNRDGIGARVEVSVRGAARRWQIVKTGSSYGSQSELPLTFGLGADTRVEGVRVRWPSGQVDTIGALEANQIVTVREGAGVADKTPFQRSQGARP
jgi:enediyne biosynthesis protein E4